MFEFFIIVIMLIFNALFAAYEMGLASISRARIIALVNDKKKGASAAAFMMHSMHGVVYLLPKNKRFKTW